MARRKIKRRRGEGIAISGAATVRVSRGVTLLVNAARTARVDRLKKLPAAVTQAKAPDKESCRSPNAGIDQKKEVRHRFTPMHTDKSHDGAK
jgi:hypothetical protein